MDTSMQEANGAAPAGSGPGSASASPPPQGHSEEGERYMKQAKENPHDFAAWEYLIQLYEGMQDFARVKEILSDFLTHFPLCFGYWRKLADLSAPEGDDKVVEVYERAVKAAPFCEEIWFYYCSFMADRVQKETYPEIKSLFERASEKIGRGFMSHPFWDRYIQLLEAFQDKAHLYTILNHLLHIPLQQYTRYYDKFIKTASQRPLEELASEDVRQELEKKVKEADESIAEEEVPNKVREAIMKTKHEIHKKTEEEARKRWSFEEGIMISYFHVKALDEGQLRNWRNYLEFEEAEGDVKKVVQLYERCLIPCALYEEMWIRYARFLARRGQIEDAREVYNRALSGFLGKKASLHVAKALFEEVSGFVDEARRLLEEARKQFAGHVETILASANLERRARNFEKAEEIYDEGMKAVEDKFSPFLACHFARFLDTSPKNVDKARKILTEAVGKYRDNKLLLTQFIQFETSHLDLDPSHIRDALALLKKSPMSGEDRAELLLAVLDSISDRAPDLTLHDEVNSEYLRSRHASSFGKKRPGEDDGPAYKLHKPEPAWARPAPQHQASPPPPHQPLPAAGGPGFPYQPQWGGYDQAAWQQPQQPPPQQWPPQ